VRPGAVSSPEHRLRERSLVRTEDAIYIGVAVVLAGLAASILVGGISEFASGLEVDNLRRRSLGLLDSLLLVLMLAELFHTVGISLKKHHIVPEPFLVVGLIAAIRRILVITAEQGTPTADNAVGFRLAMLEMGLLTLLILALVGALIAFARAKSGNGRSAGALEQGTPGNGQRRREEEHSRTRGRDPADRS
jgi:uncharacterized membrane protein (DUF373 family)